MFLNPLMLAGLGGALLPLVLHLLSRSRYRSVDWGAMMFLASADPRDSQSTRLKQYVLLALRMAIVALLAITLARPIAGQSWAGLAPPGATTAVLILDCSASMSVVEGGRSRMDAARDVASQILASMKGGDRVALLLAGADQSDGDLVPSSDLRTAAARVAAARAGLGRADLAASLSRAAQLLKRYGQGQDTRIFIVCDQQAKSWADVTPAFAASFKAQWGISDAGGGRVTAFTVGGEQADNVVVESVRLVNPPAIKGEPVDIDVRVRAIGKTAQPSVPVTLLRDGRVASNQTIAIAAGDVATARFTARFEQIRSYMLTAKVQGPGIPSDDTLDASIDVTRPIGVLLVSGDEGDGADAMAESTFFRIAAAPYTSAAAAKRGVDPNIVTVLRAEQLDSASLTKQQVVVLANVPQLSAEAQKAIEQFVYEGGGLLIAPGGMVDVDHYNATLWRGGAGLMPAELSPATSAGGGAATTLLGIDLTHPIFAFLRGRPDPIPTATIGRYFPVAPRQPDAVVPATYASGKPFLVEAKWGRGRVALLTTPLDADWSTLPLSGFYVPLVQSLTRYLSNAPDRNIAAGTSIIEVVDEVVEGEASVQLPDGRRAPAIVNRSSARTEIRYDATAMPGQYVLRYRANKEDRRVNFVVAAPPDESDITPLTPAQWNELAATLGVTRVDPNEASAATSLAGSRGGREMWGPFLALTLALLLAEMSLGRRWSAGVAR